MSRGMTRAERLREMERLYFERGWTDIEMAERLKVDRTVVYKDRHLLEAEVPFEEVERGRWKINRERYLSQVRVNLHEALALYVAARRASNQTRMAQPHLASGLEKLAVTLRQPMTERLVRAANGVLACKAQPERIAVVETLARGWVEQKKVRLDYRALHARGPWTLLVHPYLIEPSPWSDSVYVIGYSEVYNEIGPFKIERIERAELTNESFTIPDTFDEEELLRYAWGIWRGEGEPQMVVLRFAPGTATRRVKESVWHRLEEVTDLADGGCEWRAPISEWQEMVPWIRGWGSEVEVLEPKELRETLMGEAKAMAERYGWDVRAIGSGEQPSLSDTFGEFFGRE